MAEPVIHLVLASRSPRRRELLEQVGMAFSVAPADIDETRRPGEAPLDYVRRMAREKALAGRAAGGEWVLGADTTVVLDEDVLGKPADRSEAAAMLGRLAGRTHEVFSGVALAGPGDWLADDVQVSRVTFRPIATSWIEAYARTDEPMDKAGAYAVQGRTAAFIDHLDGSFSGVMGLPLAETWALLDRAGIAPTPGGNARE